MPSLLVFVAGVAVVLAIVSLVITFRIVRTNRARQAERIQALQALASAPRREPQHAEPERIVPLPAEAQPAEPHHVTLEIRKPVQADETAWDHTFRDEPVLHAHRTPAAAPAAPAPAPKPAAAHVFQQPNMVTSQPLFEETAAASRSRAPLLAMAVLILATSAGLYYILSSGIIGRVVTASPARSAPPAASTVAAPVELLSLRHSNESDAFVVTGLVQNPAAGGALRGVFAMVYLFDAEGRYFASSRAALDATTLSAGGQSAFTVRVPATTGVTKYRVSFQLEDGAAVNHVDKRGSLPDGTSGDAVTPGRATDRRK
jgi:hypothetical protein